MSTLKSGWLERNSFKMLLFGTAVFSYFLQYALSLYPPLLLFPEEVSTNSLSVRWSTFDLDASEFVAHISPGDEGEDIEPQYINESFATWVDLIPGKNYSIAVESINQDGSQTLPAFLEVITEPLPVYQVRISKFVNPVLTRHTASGNKTMMFPVYGAVVMWKGPDVGHFDGFEVRVNPPHGVVRLPVVINAGKPIPQAKKKRRIVWDLVPGIKYEFIVQTKSHNRLSKPSSSRKRMPPEIPATLRVTDLTPTSVSLSWDQPHRGLIDSYIIEISPPEGEVIAPTTATEKHRRIENLTPGSMYKVDVYSASFDLLSFQSRSIHIRTPPQPPLGPVLVSDVTTSSVVVRWRWPGHNIQYYEVVYYPTNGDYGRLRHRISDPEIQINYLKADTEYSLLFYSVTNKVYSKPLRVTIRTASLSTTPVSVTASARPVTAPQDEPEQQPATTQPNENSTRKDQSTTNTIKTDPYMYGTKTIATTPKPQLMEHFSIPYPFPGTVQPFLSTLYFADRVTSVPGAPIETTAFKFDPIVQAGFKTTTETSLTQESWSPVSVVTGRQTTTTHKPAERFESGKSSTHQPYVIVEATPTRPTFVRTSTMANRPSTTNSKVSTTTSALSNVRLIEGEALPTTTKQIPIKTVATVSGHPTAISTSGKPFTVTSTLRATMPTQASRTVLTTLPETTPTAGQTKIFTSRMETLSIGSTTEVKSTKNSLTRQETAERTTINNNKADVVATTKADVPVKTILEKFATTQAMLQSFTEKFIVNDTKPVSAAQSENTTFDTITSFSTTSLHKISTSLSTEAIFEQVTASAVLPLLVKTTSAVKNKDKQISISTDPSYISTKLEHVVTESFTSKQTGTKSTTADAIPFYSTAMKSITTESPSYRPTALERRSEVLTSTLTRPTLETTMTQPIVTKDIVVTNQTKLQTSNAAETHLGFTSTKSTTLHRLATDAQTVKSIATESNTLQPITTHSALTSLIATESPTKEQTVVEVEQLEKTKVTTLKPMVKESSAPHWIAMESKTSPLYVTKSTAKESTTRQPNVTLATLQFNYTESTAPEAITTESTTAQPIVTESTVSQATKSTMSKEIATESTMGQSNVTQAATLQIDNTEPTKLEQIASEATTLKQTATDAISLKLNATGPAAESTTKLTAFDLTSAQFTLSDKSTVGVAPVVRDARNNQTVTSTASITTTPPIGTISLKPVVSGTTFNEFSSGPRQILDHNRVSFAPTTPQTDESQLSISASTPLSDPGMTTDGGGAVPARTNETIEPIKNGFTTMCQPDNITVLVDKSVIGEYEKKFGPLHLNDQDDPSCEGEAHDSYYRYTIAPDILNCDTRIELNETHINFTNTVSNAKYRRWWLRSLTDRSGTVILGNRLRKKQMPFVRMKIWCTFPLDLNVSAQYPFLPNLRMQLINFNVSGHGKFSAFMRLYRTNKYEIAYYAPPIIDTTDTLYVELSLLETKDESTVMVVRRCWATPVRSPDHLERYPIIKKSCPIAGNLEGSIRISGNGEGKRVRWEGSVFKFISYKEVWLHCEIKICFGDNCRPDCNFNSRTRRSERSIQDSEIHILSTGPISMADRKNTNTGLSTSQEYVTDFPEAGATIIADSTIFIVVVILSVVIFASCVVIICTVARLRRYNKKETPARGVSPAVSSSSISYEPQTYPLPRYDSPGVYVERTRPQLTTFNLNHRKTTSENKTSARSTNPPFTTLELVHGHSKQLGYFSAGIYNTAYANSGTVGSDSEYASSSLSYSNS